MGSSRLEQARIALEADRAAAPPADREPEPDDDPKPDDDPEYVRRSGL